MKKLWLVFGIIMAVSFGTLLWIGTEIFREAPPIPQRVVTTAGEEVIGPEEISDGQNVWQAMGGMQVGSVWGHGSYVAPDWTADYLHREAVYLLDQIAADEYGGKYESVEADKQALVRQRMQSMLRANNYDASTGTLTIEPERAEAFRENLEHYRQVFGEGSAEYAIQKGAQSDPERLRKMVAFFFWTSWASTAHRPGDSISYTSNFPSEPLVGNIPTSSTIIWTGVSIIMLLAGIGGMAWYFASLHEEAPT
ncbi:MAG: hypothetical protein J5I65_07610 [Aridibacter famidurans]|nr:hypothetical protein [Aridibacter famidurans]